MTRRKRSLGGLRKLPSGRWQANCTGPSGVLRKATTTWLARPGARDRLPKPRTHEHWAALLDQHVLPTFGDLPLAAATVEDVARWHRQEQWHRTPLIGKFGRRSKAAAAPTLTRPISCSR